MVAPRINALSKRIYIPAQKHSRFPSQTVTEGTWCERPGFSEALFLVRAGSGDDPLEHADIRIAENVAKEEGKVTVQDPASCRSFKDAGAARDRVGVHRFFQRRRL